LGLGSKCCNLTQPNPTQKKNIGLGLGMLFWPKPNPFTSWIWRRLEEPQDSSRLHVSGLPMSFYD
jgi:hypothetical protein